MSRPDIEVPFRVPASAFEYEPSVLRRIEQFAPLREAAAFDPLGRFHVHRPPLTQRRRDTVSLHLEHSEKIGQLSSTYGAPVAVFVKRYTTMSEDLLTVVEHRTGAIQLSNNGATAIALTKTAARELIDLLTLAVDAWTDPVKTEVDE